VCNPLAGHDYGEILKRGMRKRVMKAEGGVKMIDNIAYV
jgi:hypothetical protein